MKLSTQSWPLWLLIGFAATVHSENAPDWALRCENEGEKRCYVVQNVFLAENQQRLAGLALRREREGYLLFVSTPLGVDLPSGVHVRIDDTPPLAVAYQTCNNQGCYGAMILEESRLKTWKRAQTLSVNYQDTNGHRIGIPFSLKDFARTIEQLKLPPRPSSSRHEVADQ